MLEIIESHLEVF